VSTSAEAEEAVAEILGQAFGQTASTYADEETKISLVSVYSPKKPSNLPDLLKGVKAGLETIRRCGLNHRPGIIICKRIRRESWAHSWKRHFKPIEIGSALLIKPSWNRRKPRKGQKLVVLDPGLSFGTGQHATTGFCLRQLVKRFFKSDRRSPRKTSNTRTLSRKRSFLDIGTGSGILAIAAAKLGYSPVHAFDFDPESVRVSRANAAQNGVRQQIQIVRRDLTRLSLRSARKYDIVCANLISTLLIAERERIITRVKSGGLLVLAGILETEFHKVCSVYKQAGFTLLEHRTEKEWCSGLFG
jgi:ribosomal protein L11 methyltransferase